MPHFIRLHGPWTASRVTGPTLSGDNLAPTGEVRLKLPGTWRFLFGDAVGHVVLRRMFHCPTGLTPQTQLSIRFTRCGGPGLVRVDGHELGSLPADVGDWEFPLSQPLAHRPCLEVELWRAPERDPDAIGFGGEILLVIIEPEAQQQQQQQQQQ